MPQGRGEVKALITEKVMDEWQRKWDNEVKGQNFYSVQPIVQPDRVCCPD